MQLAVLTSDAEARKTGDKASIDHLAGELKLDEDVPDQRIVLLIAQVLQLIHPEGASEVEKIR